MNSFWNSNIALFKDRFPQLEKQLPKKLADDIVLEYAKNGSPTAKYKNLMLHSKYNPEREADTLVSGFNPVEHEVALFLGCGLGYSMISFAKKFPDATMVLFEKDWGRFFYALNTLDWKDVFAHQKLILAIGISEGQSVQILSGFKTDETKIFRTKALTAHSPEYFDAIEYCIMRNSQKEEINTNTLEKFADLWLSNSCRNIDRIQELDGVKKFSGLGTDIPFVILAAGPSLKRILPHLAQVKKRAVVVCVDTALHACLKNRVEPDFIILSDPQYYCSLHLEFLSSPSSILITEIGAYPSVFRFNCREKILFSSLFPIGQYFERQFDEKGKLAAGGSVTTSAWDFARLCGAERIFIAGMDLGFPGKETHIRGSRFEEKNHADSIRTDSSETRNISTLFSACPSLAKDYNGNPIITDKRMSMFSWWFENQCTRAREAGVNTFTLTHESLAINGIEKFPLEEFLCFSEIEDAKKIFFHKADSISENWGKKTPADFLTIKENFAGNLLELEKLAKKGIDISSKALSDRTRIQGAMDSLGEIDRKILNSNAKEATSLVFPTKRQLDSMAKEIPNSSETDRLFYSIRYSKLIYTQLLEAVKKYEKFFLSFRHSHR